MSAVPAQRTVAVLGASTKPDRYSNMAIRLLRDRGFRVLPVHPRLPEVEGIPAFASLDAIGEPVDTLTLYVAEFRLVPLMDAVVALKPGRVIFNPGTECRELQHRLQAEGIPWLEACTLVLLQSGQF